MTTTAGKRGDLGDGEFARVYGWWLGSDTAWETPCPWWRPPAIDHVARILPAGGNVLEWGAGGSTLWLAARCGDLTALELDAEWHHQVQRRLELGGLLPQVRLLYFGLQVTPEARWQTYADYVLLSPDEHYDLVVVDGRARARCVGNAMAKVKSDGYLLLDNSERAEYAAAVALLRDWPRWEYGDEGWLTTLWRRPAEWVPPAEVVRLPVAEA